MPLGLEELKKKYNEVLAREKKAEEFFDDPKVSMESKEKWRPKFYEIVMELSGMMKEFRELSGEEMSESEVLKGFVIIH
ncbi:hypothetical protein [Candidatus Clostridium radicumherbarum]|uniref:Uncharacterized protein n=1 Tax=Candidatus Clostridium radicumherbarum TaxID=3381662 RepID=A0ABW8TRW4_9CLOT